MPPDFEEDTMMIFFRWLAISNSIPNSISDILLNNNKLRPSLMTQFNKSIMTHSRSGDNRAMKKIIYQTLYQFCIHKTRIS